MPSRASNAALTVDSRADRDIELSLGTVGKRSRLGGFVGIRQRRVKAHSIVVPASSSVSSPAKAGEPVFREALGLFRRLRRTGCPAFAGHDGRRVAADG